MPTSPNEPPPEWTATFDRQFSSKAVDKNATEGDGAKREQSTERVPISAEALRYAHDIRKFEIELYWKRSAYFQTVLGIILGALALTLKVEGPAGAVKWAIEPSILQSGILYLGSIIAFAWYAATRGGKYWQRNWETHVDTLENGITGPLYKTVYSKRGGLPFRHLLREYPYSTSKLNTFIALMFMVLFLTTQSVFYFFSVGVLRTPFAVGLISSCITIYLMHISTRFNVGDEAQSEHDIDFVARQRRFVLPPSR